MRKKRDLDDPDRPLTDKEWASLGPVMRGIEGLPEEMQAAIRRMRGRPAAANPKRQVTLRLDADLLRVLRASGKGWQTQVNNLLRRKWMDG